MKGLELPERNPNDHISTVIFLDIELVLNEEEMTLFKELILSAYLSFEKGRENEAISNMIAPDNILCF